MRVLGLDIGSKRVGVALSDPVRVTARPLAVLDRAEIEGEGQVLARLVSEHEVDEIVVGLPVTMSGEIGPAAKDVQAIAERLSLLLHLPVSTWDERLSTAVAENSMIEAGARRSTRKKKNDMVAAAVILQGYLDSRSHGAS